MLFRDYLENYKGKKLHFDIDAFGFYNLDFTERSYANGHIVEVHDEFLILFDMLDKSNALIPYWRVMIKLPEES